MAGCPAQLWAVGGRQALQSTRPPYLDPSPFSPAPRPGEIIPQSICSHYGLAVGAYAAPFVRLLMLLFSPIAWPISRVLDWVLGREHSTIFRRAQLKALVDLHSQRAGYGGTLSEDETHIIRGALDLTNKTALKAMTPLDKVFMLAAEEQLDEKTLHAVLLSGHSRIPVYRRSNRRDIVGLVLVKELLLVNPASGTLAGDLKLRDLPRVSAATPMYDMLKLFQTGRSHLALLLKPTEGEELSLAAQLALSSDGGDTGTPVRSGKGDGGKRESRGGASAHHGERRPLMSSVGGAGSSSSAPVADSPGWRGGANGDAWDSPRAASAAMRPSAGSPASEALLHASPGEPVGIISIEDVIEELLQVEIVVSTRGHNAPGVAVLLLPLTLEAM